MPVAFLAVAAVVSAVAAKKAAKAQSNAADAGIAEQQRQYEQTRADESPYQATGTAALAKLNDPQASFQASPGYEFTRKEGTRGIQNTFAASGGAMSGNALRALTEFSNGLASQDYGQWWNQQAGLAGIGQNAVNTLAQTGQNTANNISTLQGDKGAARASGIIGVSNSIVNAGNQYTGLKESERNRKAGFSPYQPTYSRNGVYSGYGGYNPWVKY